MKHINFGLSLFAVVAFSAGAFAGSKNYTLSIDGKIYDVEPGDTITAQSKSGSDIVVTFNKNEYSIFEKSKISFEYPGNLSVASSDIDADIHQHLVASALGTMLLIQSYDNLSVEGLTEVLFTAITKDDAKLNAKIERSPFSRTLSDGTVVSGIKARITAPTDDVTVQVLGANRDNGSVIAVTRIDASMGSKEQPLVDRFWDTLKIK
jgi:type 1 fimbria pilin